MDVIVLTDKGAFKGNIDESDKVTIHHEITTTEEFLAIHDIHYEHDISDIPWESNEEDCTCDWCNSPYKYEDD